MSETHVKGLADLQKFLDMRGALRAGMKPIVAAAKENAAVASGKLRDGLKVYTRIKNGVVTAKLRTTGKHAFIALWIEFGTSAHRIKGKKGGYLAIGGGYYKSVEHPGIKARPFMRPAIDGQAQNAVVAAAEYMKKRLENKHGLDTSDVVIEGEGE